MSSTNNKSSSSSSLLLANRYLSAIQKTADRQQHWTDPQHQHQVLLRKDTSETNPQSPPSTATTNPSSNANVREEEEEENDDGSNVHVFRKNPNVTMDDTPAASSSASISTRRMSISDRIHQMNFSNHPNHHVAVSPPSALECTRRRRRIFTPLPTPFQRAFCLYNNLLSLS